jgi:hypothetical protein
MKFKTFLQEEKDLKAEYEDYFQGVLKKYGVKSPAELSDEDKKKFYDEVEAGWEEGKGRK